MLWPGFRRQTERAWATEELCLRKVLGHGIDVIPVGMAGLNKLLNSCREVQHYIPRYDVFDGTGIDIQRFEIIQDGVFASLDTKHFVQMASHKRWVLRQVLAGLAALPSIGTKSHLLTSEIPRSNHSLVPDGSCMIKCLQELAVPVPRWPLITTEALLAMVAVSNAWSWTNAPESLASGRSLGLVGAIM
jgi:hypothetical protein